MHQYAHLYSADQNFMLPSIAHGSKLLIVIKYDSEGFKFKNIFFKLASLVAKKPSFHIVYGNKPLHWYEFLSHSADCIEASCLQMLNFPNISTVLGPNLIVLCTAEGLKPG